VHTSSSSCSTDFALGMRGGRLLFRGESAGDWDERVSPSGRRALRTKQLTALRESRRVVVGAGDLSPRRQCTRSLTKSLSRLLLRCNNPLADDTYREARPAQSIAFVCASKQTNRTHTEAMYTFGAESDPLAPWFEFEFASQTPAADCSVHSAGQTAEGSGGYSHTRDCNTYLDWGTLSSWCFIFRPICLRSNQSLFQIFEETPFA
jgi:hypothetical protein